MAHTQDLIFTVLPFGQSTTSDGVFLDFSVIVSPRLNADTSATQSLGDYLDWANPAGGGGRTWPETVAALKRSFKLFVGSPVGHAYPATLISEHLHDGTAVPDAGLYGSLFPNNLDVTPYVYQDMSNRAIRSAPVGTVVDKLHDLYGQFGFTSPDAFPKYADLVPTGAFGPMGFQQTNPLRTGPGTGVPGDGTQRKAVLDGLLDETLKKSKAVPYDLAQLGASTGFKGAAESLAFLQHQRFHQRGLPAVQDQLTTRPDVPDWDFHKIVAGLGSMPTILRVMGLVLDLRAGPIDTSQFPNWTGNSGDEVVVHFVLNQAKFLTPFHQPPVMARTKALVHQGIFRPLAKSPATSDHVLRMLRLGNQKLFPVIRVDHDSAAIKTIQFANNVTRSREGTRKLTPMTPDRYALPALRTGGFAIARSGRAVEMAARLKRQTADLQDGYFGNNPSTPTLFEDDLIRGYRFDVVDVTRDPVTHEIVDGVWRSLMWRQGTVTINGTAIDGITEEDTIVPAPTTATRGGGNHADLYLQETLARWDGWSLAVPRVGRPAVGTSAGGAPDSPFDVQTDWHVPGSVIGGAAETGTNNHHRLPRLRFGRLYQVRARTADLAGNALSVDKAPAGAAVVSPELRHLRFEPVPAPRVLLVQGEDLRPGGTEEVIVVRSESATVDGPPEGLDNPVSTRIVVPAPTSVFMAEQHGAWDEPLVDGDPMNQAQALFDLIANRDAANVVDDAKLARADSDPLLAFGVANPLLYPEYLRIKYLPEVLGRTALVRNLPVNADKKTTAELPFDTAGNGWPFLRATRIRLTRGATTWSTREVTDPDDSGDVTTELDVRLAKGVTVHTLVNGSINANALSIMAVWEWIRDYAAAHNLSVKKVQQIILAGEHWMFTPWRQVTLVHAVRTPLKDPQLFLAPAKKLGDTFATFTGGRDDPKDGTILFSRRSTARLDIDATWSMPIDTGTNGDPVTPRDFQGHAFSLDVARAGGGWAPAVGNNPIEFTVDAENLAGIHHEFGDTKFRAVTYAGTATSEYVEYFREAFVPDLGADPLSVMNADPFVPGVAFEGSTVQLTLSWVDGGTTRTRKLVPAPAGTPVGAPAPTPGDYVVVEDPALNDTPATATNGSVQILDNAAVLTGRTAEQKAATARIEFSYVGPTIHTFSHPAADKTVKLHVLNSARPKAPKVRYVIPIYKRSVRGTTATRTGGALRVYLERPWWSSGDEERLGVVCWHPRSGDNGALPKDTTAPYVTQWGFDPVFKSANVPAQPTPACFPLATKSRTDGRLTLDESSALVDVAGHDVGWDEDRGLWYCDIHVTDAQGKELSSYMPFIRLALARFQPFSVPDAHLSKVVLADYAQLAPNRHVTITGTGDTRAVTVVGRAPVGTDAHPTLESRMVLIVEEQDTRIPDDAIAWGPAAGGGRFKNRIAMSSSHSGKSDEVTWRASVLLPTNNRKPLRFTFEEYERINKTGEGRLVFTESVPITHVVTG